MQRSTASNNTKHSVILHHGLKESWLSDRLAQAQFTVQVETDCMVDVLSVSTNIGFIILHLSNPIKDHLPAIQDRVMSANGTFTQLFLMVIAAPVAGFNDLARLQKGWKGNQPTIVPCNHPLGCFEMMVNLINAHSQRNTNAARTAEIVKKEVAQAGSLADLISFLRTVPGMKRESHWNQGDTSLRKIAINCFASRGTTEANDQLDDFLVNDHLLN